MMTQEQIKLAEEKSICQKFWEMDSFLEDSGWKEMGRGSLELIVEIGERILHGDNFEIKKNVDSVVSRYKNILANLARYTPCED